jgi:two-component system, chemotaxis family, sensor kinase CheA
VSAELDGLLADEIARRLPLFARALSDPLDVRAALHSLRGAAAMAGYSDLALVITQLGTRVREGEAGATLEAHEVLAGVLERLLQGHTPLETRWPEPPLGLWPSSVDSSYRDEYHSAMRDRLGEIDALLASTEGHGEALDAAQRTVHAMKGAAAGAGDDVTAWYCHGLEGRLKDAPRDRKTARDALVELARHRAVLSLLVEDPARALDLLRVAPLDGHSRRPPGQRTAPPTKPPVSELPPEEFRLPQRTLERFLERLERLDGMHDSLAGASDVARRMAGRLHEIRMVVLDALRRIGPPRPWGPPAAALQQLESSAESIRRAAGRAERGARMFRDDAEALRDRVGAMRGELSLLRRTTVSFVFERVTRAAERYAQTEGKLVTVETSGGDVAIERRVAERLVDPIVQLVRNAVAHGIAMPEQRIEQGKAAHGTISLRAERRGTWLRLQVEDDGRGADVARIRELVVASGIVSPELARRAREQELLRLLFSPGLSTAESSDLLAGRGIGLDLVQDALRRLGGAVSLQQRPAGGLAALLEIPLDQKLVDVLWIEEAGYEYALPVSFTGRVLALDAASPPRRLSACLGFEPRAAANLGLELVVHGLERVVIGVDGVGKIEEASIRAIGPTLAAAGPYCGAVLRSDGSLRLVLDAPTLAVSSRDSPRLVS